MRHLAVLSLLVVACGGKIAPDPNAQTTASPATTASAEPASAPPEPASVDAACNTICERNARCGAYQGDCVDRCLAGAAGRCAREAVPFTLCWARTADEGCGELAPECEPAYCALTACTGEAAPAYCR